MLASKPGSGGQFKGYVPSLDLERGRQAEQETGTLRINRTFLAVNTQVE